MDFFVEHGKETVRVVRTASIDDFYYLRDSVHNALEEGEFGSRFPVFMQRFEPDEWRIEELEELQRELDAIADAFKKLPPAPFDPHWESRLVASGRSCSSLYEVFVDAEGSPLLGRLLDLCRLAQAVQAPIIIR